MSFSISLIVVLLGQRSNGSREVRRSARMGAPYVLVSDVGTLMSV